MTRQNVLLLAFLVIMGCCLEPKTVNSESRLHNDEPTDAASELIKPLSQNEENALIEVKVDNIDPWQYSNSLTITEVTDLLSNMTFDYCKPFVAPIRFAKVVKVYDGDTVHIIAPLFEGVTSRFSVRLRRIDAPEIRTKDEWMKKAGYIVRDMLSDKINNQIIELQDVKYDKYGRILAEIVMNGENINSWLLSTEWVCEYDGKGDKLTKSVDWKSKVEEYEQNNTNEA